MYVFIYVHVCVCVYIYERETTKGWDYALCQSPSDVSAACSSRARALLIGKARLVGDTEGGDSEAMIL